LNEEGKEEEEGRRGSCCFSGGRGNNEKQVSELDDLNGTSTVIGLLQR